MYSQNGDLGCQVNLASVALGYLVLLNLTYSLVDQVAAISLQIAGLKEDPFPYLYIDSQERMRGWLSFVSTGFPASLR